jgi:hypothetical protein
MRKTKAIVAGVLFGIMLSGGTANACEVTAWELNAMPDEQRWMVTDMGTDMPDPPTGYKWIMDDLTLMPDPTAGV